MTDNEIDQARQLLIALKAELIQRENTFNESCNTVELDQARVGRLTRMDAMQGQQMALESSRQRQHKIKKADIALRRIDAGEYGYCMNCDEEINIKRLFVDPTNTLCIKCAEESEG